MGDEDDILRKADALMRRSEPAKTPGEDDDFPVLTDLIAPGSPPPARAAIDDGPASEDAQDTAAAIPAAERGTEAATDPVAEITMALQVRLAHDLERRLRQHEIAGVGPEVAAALKEFERDIAAAVGDTVSEALARRPLP